VAEIGKAEEGGVLKPFPGFPSTFGCSPGRGGLVGAPQVLQWEIQAPVWCFVVFPLAATSREPIPELTNHNSGVKGNVKNKNDIIKAVSTFIILFCLILDCSMPLSL
jgi:hypothetical protein